MIVIIIVIIILLILMKNNNKKEVIDNNSSMSESQNIIRKVGRDEIEEEFFQNHPDFDPGFEISDTDEINDLYVENSIE